MKNEPIVIANHVIEPGTHATIALPSAELYTQTKMGIPIHVFHGKEAGPRLFVTSAIHGDELNSIEIIRRLHLQKSLHNLKGTLITIPVVNVYGFILQSRYLPDRRDLNRSFPGSKKGSLAARLANLLCKEIISQCDYGIDLHTGAYGRINLPQLRVNLSTQGTKELAKAFDVPVIIDAVIRDGSLRQAATELGIPVLVYEGGEALRFNELCIKVGLRGIINTLNYLGMIETPKTKISNEHKPLITAVTRWVRASTSGMLQPIRDFTKSFAIKKGDILAHIHDPFQINPSETVLSPLDGILVGMTNLPVVNEGDAIYNIASTKKLKAVEDYLVDLREEIMLHY